MSGSLRFVKGHGTENDFVLLPDADGRRELDPATVVALCDRRTGIGADGVIRVVRSEAYDDPAADQAAAVDAAWFMDYRNRDGSLSQMCGNGIRVLGRYLVEHEGAPADLPLRVGTRAGVKVLTFAADGRVGVDMGPPRVLEETKVAVAGRTWTATHISMGNPHAVVVVDDLADAGDLRTPPGHDKADFPEGVNVEFVVRGRPGHLAMRVHERGSGETRSCGTGACAAMVAVAVADRAPRGRTYHVDVPGGRLDVSWTPADRVLLTGPAVLVAEGTWLAG